MRIGTRKSRLAVAQASLFAEACRRAEEDLRAEGVFCGTEYEIVKMSTLGDKITDRPLREFEGKGMFTSVFEDALRAGKIDVAVHSGKDMPMELPEGFVVGAVLKRENPCDMLIEKKGKELGEKSVIATGSLRRKELVREYLHCRTKEIRGNVDTRLKKLEMGEADGLILAAAGLIRLGLLKEGQWDSKKQCIVYELQGYELTARQLPLKEFLPAPAQGIIVAETLEDGPYRDFLRKVNDEESYSCLMAERGYLKEKNAGCERAIAAYAYYKEGQLCMDTRYWE